MSAAADAARLATVRADLDAIPPGSWSLACDGDGMMLEVGNSQGGFTPIARFDRAADPAEMQFCANAPDTVRFLLGLVDRAIERLRPASPPEDHTAPAAPRNYAAEAAIKCGEPGFKKFLEENHGLERPLTDERAAQKLRGLLGVTSRRELNSDADAAERWKRLRGEFESWRRTG